MTDDTHAWRRHLSGSGAKAGALVASVGAVSFLHYVTGPPESLWHAVFQHLYHVPVIFGAYWFGARSWKFHPDS
jgi:hypothetical protein